MNDLERRYRDIADLWCAQAWERWQSTTAPGYTFDPGVGEPRDLAGTLEWSRSIFAAFPDYRQELLDVIVSGRAVTGYALARGTSRGPLALGGRSLPPTGGTFALPYVKVLYFDEQGLVREDRQFMDHARLVEQIHRTAQPA